MSDILSSLPPNRLHFFCQGIEVGYFIHESYPASDGVYEYMAYRGPGHMQMALRCDEDGEAPCYHLGTDPPTHFVARPTEESGELALSDFTLSPLPEHFKPRIDDLPFADDIELKEAASG